MIELTFNSSFRRAAGGLDAEREERQRQRDVEREEHMKNIEAMRKIMDAARAKRKVNYPDYPDPEDVDREPHFEDEREEKVYRNMVDKMANIDSAVGSSESMGTQGLLTSGSCDDVPDLEQVAPVPEEDLTERPPIRRFVQITTSGKTMTDIKNDTEANQKDEHTVKDKSIVEQLSSVSVQEAEPEDEDEKDELKNLLRSKSKSTTTESHTKQPASMTETAKIVELDTNETLAPATHKKTVHIHKSTHKRQVRSSNNGKIVEIDSDDEVEEVELTETTTTTANSRTQEASSAWN